MSKSMKQRFLADLSWGITRIYEDFFVKRFRLPLMSIPTSTPNTYEKVKVTKNVAAPMRDGIKLYADIYRPDTDDAGSFPVVLTRLPYGKSEPYCAMETRQTTDTTPSVGLPASRGVTEISA